MGMCQWEYNVCAVQQDKWQKDQDKGGQVGSNLERRCLTRSSSPSLAAAQIPREKSSSAQGRAQWKCSKMLLLKKPTNHQEFLGWNVFWSLPCNTLPGGHFYPFYIWEIFQFCINFQNKLFETNLAQIAFLTIHNILHTFSVVYRGHVRIQFFSITHFLRKKFLYIAKRRQHILNSFIIYCLSRVLDKSYIIDKRISFCIRHLFSFLNA